jgi:hypothetical protein
MIFRVDKQYFKVGASRTTDLLMFLRAAASRGHTVFIVSDVLGHDIDDTPEFAEWSSAATTEVQHEIRLMTEVLRRVSPNAVARGATVVAVPWQRDATHFGRHVVLTLTEATRLASMPLFVLVENGLSDSAFLRRVMPPRWRNKINEWERAGYIHFENGGGISEMDRIVDYFSTGKAPDPAGLGRAAWCAAHVFISDRDSNSDGSISSDSNRLKQTCAAAGLEERLHILDRRDQESYLPPEALFEIVGQKTDSGDRQKMADLLKAHLSRPDSRNHHKTPTLSEKSTSWFKNAFLTAEVGWKDEWFERDGSAQEMIDIAEKIAAFL